MANISPSEVAKYLQGINFPVKKDVLIAKARENGASDEIISVMEGMRGDEFRSMNEVQNQFAQQR